MKKQNLKRLPILSRPRRFGKSLSVDTLQEIFEGNKKLFGGLYIEDEWDWNDKYPVIKISFGGSRSTNELKKVILDIFRYNQKKLSIKCHTTFNIIRNYKRVWNIFYLFKPFEIIFLYLTPKDLRDI